MMDVTKAQIPKSRERLTKWSLFLGIVIWFTDLNSVYALPSVACNWGWFPFTILGIPGLQLVEGLITIIAMLLMVLMIYLPWRYWHAYQRQKPADNPHMLKDTGQDRRPLMAFVAMGLNSFFFLFIIAFFVPMITLNACVQG